jgi:hypothetical protein
MAEGPARLPVGQQRLGVPEVRPLTAVSRMSRLGDDIGVRKPREARTGYENKQSGFVLLYSSVMAHGKIRAHCMIEIFLLGGAIPSLVSLMSPCPTRLPRAP